MSKAHFNKTVLVTGIGGNVGQGVLRNIRSAYDSIRIVGTDIGSATAGHHFCDVFHQVPYCYQDNFSDRIKEICEKENVDLIIPTTDYECVHIGELRNELPTVLVSPPETARLSLDKHLSFQRLTEKDVPFVETMLVSEYDKRWKEIVVKPREGRGSRNVHINPDSLEQFDDSYIVQPRLIGPEITSAFYVTRKQEIFGPMTFVRELSSGMTERCNVSFDYNDAVLELIKKFTSSFTVSGPCNIQSIVLKDGTVLPFEVNCRYSGTNSIRSQFGFKDVFYGIEEYLYDRVPEAPIITKGSAIRIYMDIIYPDSTLEEIEAGNEKSHIF